MSIPASTPAVIGKYKITRELGSGSFGITYLATRIQTGENPAAPLGESVPLDEHDQVALKILKADAASDGRMRFKNECWALGQVQHPSLPSIIEQGDYDNRPFFVMTLAQGESLRKRLGKLRRDNGVFSEMVSLRILIAILEALVELHKYEIFHRDVKDDNVIATVSADHVTLIDLGYCKGTNQPVDADSFNNVGAPRFSPPAKLENPSRAFASHDVFAVGVLGYLLVTGEYPWSVPQDEDRGVLKHLMESAVPVEPITHNHRISREYNGLIRELIQVSDVHRPDAATALLHAKK